MKRLTLMVLMFVMVGGAAMLAKAAEFGQNEVAAIQGAVQLQIEALANDDAAGAFALTTENTRSRLGSPDNFLKMIKEQYDPVYRHRLALYQSPQIVFGKVYQVVRLTDLESHVWVAIYLMHKDEEGAWKIDGCRLIQTKTIAV
ncbi:DUF4864 domain-containing protein [Noviherbaspirillum sedimenti]|uniref:DUF4864 domain-containing protein n=1 Tax=Noviherbaspirillum sedimenti TaxID=2320865 RepID=A0A3A3GNR4_9BURK|nr:DUF4864 domain-containing protein [Noviherbaspirillum sedimenti]RJG03956.1 DUF4864 domain-containing protein [Noviherbaspirillum sedimenti]